jgi:hypothetical protein
VGKLPVVLKEWCGVLSLFGSWTEGSWGECMSVGVWGIPREDVEDVAESRSLNVKYLRLCLFSYGYTHSRNRSAQDMSPSKSLFCLGSCDRRDDIEEGPPRSWRKVDPVRLVCARPLFMIAGDGGEFEKTFESRHPCSSYMLRRLATEGSERRPRSWFWSLGVAGVGFDVGMLLEWFSCGRC